MNAPFTEPAPQDLAAKARLLTQATALLAAAERENAILRAENADLRARLEREHRRGEAAFVPAARRE